MSENSKNQKHKKSLPPPQKNIHFLYGSRFQPRINVLFFDFIKINVVRMLGLGIQVVLSVPVKKGHIVDLFVLDQMKIAIVKVINFEDRTRRGGFGVQRFGRSFRMDLTINKRFPFVSVYEIKFSPCVPIDFTFKKSIKKINKADSNLCRRL